MCVFLNMSGGKQHGDSGVTVVMMKGEIIAGKKPGQTGIHLTLNTPQER